MMRKFMKLLMVALVITSIFTFVPSKESYAATKKAKVTYTLKKGTLTINGKGKMPKSMTFINNKKIKKVVIKKGVTSISDTAFMECKNLKSVSIAKTVKSIGEYSFAYTKIKDIVIPNSVKKMGVEAFANCNKLTTLNQISPL